MADTNKYEACNPAAASAAAAPSDDTASASAPTANTNQCGARNPTDAADASALVAETNNDEALNPTIATTTVGPKADAIKSGVLCNFTGSWLCTDLEGDFDELLTKTGAGWMKRNAARAMGYAKGKQRQDIQQDGNRLVIRNAVAGSVREDTQLIGGGEQDILDLEGNKVRGSLSWEGNAVLMKLSNGMVVKRYMDADMMIVEASLSGTTVKRKFTKQ